ncbi:General secretion pathway protein J [Pseudoalteromonas luteoviolacea B = ATCC 29581]|nr:General secretion pathway protein J [Pseudoalteromonas luteoviolacea B = ATCC 29581]
MKQKGFTLLEVMVALAILAVVVMATHQILESTMNAQEASEETLVEIEQWQTVFRFMDQDFSQMSSREVRNEVGDEAPSYVLHGRYQFESQYDGIGFVRDGWINPISLLPRSELQAVGYRVVDDKLQRMYRIYVDQLDGTEPKVQVLLDDVEELKFEFLDKAQKWQEEWRLKALPLAIAVTVKQKDKAQIRRVFAVPGLGEEVQTSPNSNDGARGGENG